MSKFKISKMLRQLKIHRKFVEISFGLIIHCFSSKSDEKSRNSLSYLLHSTVIVTCSTHCDSIGGRHGWGVGNKRVRGQGSGVDEAK